MINSHRQKQQYMHYRSTETKPQSLPCHKEEERQWLTTCNREERAVTVVKQLHQRVPANKLDCVQSIKNSLFLITNHEDNWRRKHPTIALRSQQCRQTKLLYGDSELYQLCFTATYAAPHF